MVVDVAELAGIQPFDRFLARLQAQHVAHEERKRATAVGFQPAGAPGALRGESGRARVGQLTQIAVEGAAARRRPAQLQDLDGSGHPARARGFVLTGPPASCLVPVVHGQAFQELRPGRHLAWSGRALAGQALRRDRHQPAHRLPVGGRLPRRAVVGQPRPRQQQPLARPGDRLVEELSLGALGGEFQRQAALDAQAPAIGVAQEGVLAQRCRELPFGQPQHRHGPERQAAGLDDVGDQDLFAVGVERAGGRTRRRARPSAPSRSG